MVGKGRGAVNRLHGNNMSGITASGSAESDIHLIDYNNFILRLLIPQNIVRFLIGKKHSCIYRIQFLSHTLIHVEKLDSNIFDSQKIISIFGDIAQVVVCIREILNVLKDKVNITHGGNISLNILACDSVIGHVIGFNGATVCKLMNDTNTHIVISPVLEKYESPNLDTIITISGEIGNIVKAGASISSIIQKNHMYTEVTSFLRFLYPVLDPRVIMSFIGQGDNCKIPPQLRSADFLITSTIYISNGVFNVISSHIPTIVAFCGVSLNIPHLIDQDQDQKSLTRRVIVDGSYNDVMKFQYNIISFIKLGNFMSTPTAVKVNMTITSKKLGHIISERGLNVREMSGMNSQQAAVQLDRDTTMRIVGPFSSEPFARRHIHEKVSEASMSGCNYRIGAAASLFYQK